MVDEVRDVVERDDLDEDGVVSSASWRGIRTAAAWAFRMGVTAAGGPILGRDGAWVSRIRLPCATGPVAATIGVREESARRGATRRRGAGRSAMSWAVWDISSALDRTGTRKKKTRGYPLTEMMLAGPKSNLLSSEVSLDDRSGLKIANETLQDFGASNWNPISKTSQEKRK